MILSVKDQESVHVVGHVFDTIDNILKVASNLTWMSKFLIK